MTANCHIQTCGRAPGADVPAYDGSSLALRQGELIVLVRENCSGKTGLSALLTRLRVAASPTAAR
ncbi:hypothetical protein ACIBBE_21715 [Streptomyces sp. NPDC051644]|uniref:hypothetical protein n=1 Tax=Streptomyces sp. NPDC051644 TaxID=3365666 RepID=UPI0037A0F41B